MADTINISIIENLEKVRVSINECGISKIWVDGVTITGTGLTADSPLVATAGEANVTIIGLSGVSTYTLVKSQWQVHGAIPVIQVFYNPGSGWVTIPIQPVYDAMPAPQSIYFNFGAIGSYYIVLK